MRSSHISGGVGVQMADAAVGFGLDVAPLSESAQKRLKAALPYASPRNPVDITAQAFNRVELIADNLGIVLEEEQHDAVVAFFTYVAAAEGMIEPIRDAIHAARERRPGCALVLSNRRPPGRRAPVRGGRLPRVRGSDPRGPIRGGPPPIQPDLRGGRGRSPLGTRGPRVERHDHRAAHIRACPRAPFRNGRRNASFRRRECRWSTRSSRAPPTRPRGAAAAIGSPVAVKLCAPGVLHKTEVGGVVLDVSSEAEARQAYETITSRARTASPAAEIEGVLIAPMVTGGVETILGVRHDPTFGPVVMFGLGGTLVEIIEDVSFRVAPFGEGEARRMIAGTRAGKVLRGARGRGPYDVAALAAALSRLSVFAAEHGDRIDSAEVNPFVVLPEGQGAVALDAVIVPCISERIT